MLVNYLSPDLCRQMITRYDDLQTANAALARRVEEAEARCAAMEAEHSILMQRMKDAENTAEISTQRALVGDACLLDIP